MLGLAPFQVLYIDLYARQLFGSVLDPQRSGSDTAPGHRGTSRHAERAAPEIPSYLILPCNPVQG